MDKVIVTVLLIIGGVVAAFAIMNGMYPALERSSSAISAATNQVSDQIKSQIKIINVASEGTSVQAWVKNVGASTIAPVENSDVFISNGITTERYIFGDNATLPYWDYQILGGGTAWGPSVTNQIILHLEAPLTAGLYQLKFVIPNGIFDEATFGD